MSIEAGREAIYTKSQSQMSQGELQKKIGIFNFNLAVRSMDLGNTLRAIRNGVLKTYNFATHKFVDVTSNEGNKLDESRIIADQRLQWIEKYVFDVPTLDQADCLAFMKHKLDQDNGDLTKVKKFFHKIQTNQLLSKAEKEAKKKMRDSAKLLPQYEKEYLDRLKVYNKSAALANGFTFQGQTDFNYDVILQQAEELSQVCSAKPFILEHLKNSQSAPITKNLFDPDFLKYTLSIYPLGKELTAYLHFICNIEAVLHGLPKELEQQQKQLEEMRDNLILKIDPKSKVVEANPIPKPVAIVDLSPRIPGAFPVLPPIQTPVQPISAPPSDSSPVPISIVVSPPSPKRPVPLPIAQPVPVPAPSNLKGRVTCGMRVKQWFATAFRTLQAAFAKLFSCCKG